MSRFLMFSLVLLAACTHKPDPCALECISTFVQWEEGYATLP
jgi:hypothetical protein